MDRLISEQAVLNVINRYGTDELRIKAIKAIPSAEPKTGRWIMGKFTNDDIRYNDISYKCNKCGKVVDFEENYCPNCGAKMVEPERSEE